MLTLAGTFSTSIPEPGTGVVGYRTGLDGGLAATRWVRIGRAVLRLRDAVWTTPDLGLGAVERPRWGARLERY